MGAMHLEAYSKTPNARVTAVCSGNPRRRSGDLTDVGGNLPGKAVVHDFSAMQTYENWRALIDDPDLDIVDICLPTDLHAQVALAALAAGKHVLCEKPMALTLADCDRMMAAAVEHNRFLMVGQVLRFWPEYAYLRRFVQTAEYGRVRSATFVRRSSVPDWSGWLLNDARSGGAIVDLLLHDVDQALDLLGVPERVAAKSMGGPDTVMATLIYPGGPEVRIQGGWFTPGTEFSMSFQVRADRAELEWRPDGLALSDLTGERRRVDLPESDAYHEEVSYFVDCCRNGTPPERCSPQASALALKVALMIKESRAAGGQQLLYQA